MFKKLFLIILLLLIFGFVGSQYSYFGIIYDSNGVESGNFEDRLLKDSSGNTVIDWENQTIASGVSLEIEDLSVDGTFTASDSEGNYPVYIYSESGDLFFDSVTEGSGYISLDPYFNVYIDAGYGSSNLYVDNCSYADYCVEADSADICYEADTINSLSASGTPTANYLYPLDASANMGLTKANPKLVLTDQTSTKSLELSKVASNYQAQLINQVVYGGSSTYDANVLKSYNDDSELPSYGTNEFGDANLVTNIVGSSIRINSTIINYPITVYGVGTAYTLTTSSAAVDLGTTDPAITVDKTGTYALRAKVVLKYNGATFAANQNVTIKLRRTNNTAADVSNSSTVIVTGIVTTVTESFATVSLPEVIYTTTNTDDSITIYADVATAPSAGSLDVTEASIFAQRLY